MKDHNNNGISDDLEFQADERRWFARKTIANRAFKAFLIILFGLITIGLVNAPLLVGLEPISDIIIWGLAGLISLVGTFMGVSTWYDVSKKR